MIRSWLRFIFESMCVLLNDVAKDGDDAYVEAATIALPSIGVGSPSQQTS